MARSYCKEESLDYCGDWIATALGPSASTIIDLISRQAQDKGLAVFLVGGVVRDLILGMHNVDLDIVTEGDAISFARSMAAKFGGTIHAHPPFGTAKWLIDRHAAKAMRLDEGLAPVQVDFATARGETYRTPAALPSVAPADISSDLKRRDFSINALAVQLDPSTQEWHILDPHGGRADIDHGLIRVLHDRSFLDDPTRILRAFRFASRFDFRIEAGTESLMRAALPTLNRLSGQRIRNELSLAFAEHHPEQIILNLQSLGVFEQIYPAWRVPPQMPSSFANSRTYTPPWTIGEDNTQELCWHFLMMETRADDVIAICRRLALTQKLTKSIAAFVQLLAIADGLRESSLQPSQVTTLLDDKPTPAVHALWVCLLDSLLAKQRIERFMSEWRLFRPKTNGEELKRLGLPPGPIYRHILDQLRFGWIDGDIKSDAEEHNVLQALLTNAAQE